jgi:protein-S-isoprenylcysteine O-methyltransferase Ste14
MRAARVVVVIFLGALAVLVALWGGSLAVAGAFGHSTEDLPPWFFVVFGCVLLVLSGVIAWAALMVHRDSGGPGRWSLSMLLLLVLGVAVGSITGFWLGVFVLGGLVVIATAIRSVAQHNEEDAHGGL